MAGFRSHVTYANVIATLALFIALGGGAYAAIRLPKNSVTAKQIKNRLLISVVEIFGTDSKSSNKGGSISDS